MDLKLKAPVTLRSNVTGGSNFGVKMEAGQILFDSSPENKVNPLTFSMPVYAADVISSLQNLLIHDVGRKKVIKGADLDALKEFLTVLSKYLDLGQQYNNEIAYLRREVYEKPEIQRQEWLGLMTGMTLSTDKVQYIACRGSKPYLRGYPCGLWIMFHAMTVNRYIKGEKSGRLEIIKGIFTLIDGTAPIAHALNRFVPRFFSCGYCAFHFAKMTSNVRLEGESVYPDRPGDDPPFPLEVPDPATLPAAPKSARDEVLWLNTAHNMVNKRLSGHPSEDPLAPKIVFPSPEQCRACWSEAARRKVAMDKFSATPDKAEELLAYLVHQYRPSSWRWDGVCVSFEAISHMNLGADTFSTTDMILVGVICVCCSAALAVLAALICCRWRWSRRDHLPLSTTA
ncbi:unnamed protein product [Hydatigera taeniaeformis]|uniref:Sulfhydryl oxidase n=1 Tax=Hydatigena taeniaeformis TaxID=6205 RepID=A0A3P7EQN6_HYDTA|nr:unnamed protein product [Hydatigera taeniaeformis]